MLKFINSDYKITINDDKAVFVIDASASAVTMRLPLCVDITELSFRKIDDSLNPVEIKCSGLDKIENETSYYLREPEDGIQLWADHNLNKWWIFKKKEITSIAVPIPSSVSEGPFSISGAVKTTSLTNISGTNYPDTITWWTSSDQTTKLFEELRTYDGSARMTHVVYKTYTSGNVVSQTAIDTIQYTGSVEIYRTRGII